MSEDTSGGDKSFEELSVPERLKQEIDELRVQIHLGKAEAEDFIEAHKDQFARFLMGVRERVGEASEFGDEKAQAIRQKLDELRVQLALGKMESRGALDEQRAKIGGAVSELKKELEPLEGEAGGIWKTLKEQFEAGSEALKTKMDALGLNIGLASAEIGEEWKLKKDQFGEELRDLSIRVHDAGQSAKGKFNEVGEEISEAFSSLRGKLKDLF